MSKVNMIAAAKATLELARSHGFDNQESDVEHLDFPHLNKMVNQMEFGGFDEGKLGRYLGWIQAAVVAGTNGEISMEDMRRINNEAKEP